jgi:hypothetical protein
LFVNYLSVSLRGGTVNDQVFVGSWLVSYLVGEPPSVLTRESINPLAAEAAVSFLAGGALIASGSPAYPVPDQATSGDRLLVGTGCGSWAMSGELTATVRIAALLRHEDGNSVATVFVDTTVQLDPDNDTFSGPYTVVSHLSRAWTRNLPSLDGSVQGWRIGTPTGAGTAPDH